MVFRFQSSLDPRQGGNPMDVRCICLLKRDLIVVGFFSCGSSHREEFSFRLSHFQPGEMGAAQSWATRPSAFCWRRKRRRRRAPIIPTNLTPLCSQEGSRHRQICQLFFHIFFFLWQFDWLFSFSFRRKLASTLLILFTKMDYVGCVSVRIVLGQFTHKGMAHYFDLQWKVQKMDQSDAGLWSSKTIGIFASLNIYN